MSTSGYTRASRSRRRAARLRLPAPSQHPLIDDLCAAGSHAFSLIEVLIVVALIGTIMAIAMPLYMDALDNARVGHAQGDISSIAREVELFFFENGRYPATLAEINRNNELDPYGNLYVYGVIGGKGYMGRRDKFLVPVNSDFDLYSKGKDGETTTAFTAKNSHDDIVRAANGGYIGLVEDF